MALSSLITVKKLDDSKQQLYVPLCDVLLDPVETNIDGPDALMLSQTVHSLAHDILNMATLAGRLLWCEGVTPDMSRSPDLVAVGVDAESYLVLLRTACDIIADVFAKFCVDPKRNGQLPKEKSSLRALLFWARDNPERLRENFRFITDHFDWFMELRGYRDRIVHQGFYSNVYTERDFFQFFLMPGGVAELQWLHGGYKEEDHQPDKPRFQRVPLLSWLKGLTISVLELAEQLSSAIEKQLGVQRSHTHVLSGVYVPALHHLLAYEQPRVGHLLNEKEMRRRHIAAWHLLKAGDYLSAAERGYPNEFWWRFVTHLCDLFTAPPRYVSEPKFARRRILVDWKFVFDDEEQNFALCLRDMISAEDEWVEGVRANLDSFAQRADATRSLLVARKVVTPRNSPTDIAVPANIIVDADPICAAERAFAALKQPQADATPND
jgi:hypothetical protein